MGFKRVWDASCPMEWDSWEADGARWVIRDLRPEDDDEAIDMLVHHLCTDETLCALSGIIDDPLSVRSLSACWRYYFRQRMALACYQEKDGNSKLVAMNACFVQCQGDEEYPIEGKAWKNVYDALKVCDDKLDVFKLLGVDKLLYALGLVVHRDYRGAKLGARILAAREPLALHTGVLATSTVFTGPAAHKSAARAGLSTVLTVTLKELAEAGLDYPKDENRCIKVMVKRYDGKVINQ